MDSVIGRGNLVERSPERCPRKPDAGSVSAFRPLWRPHTSGLSSTVPWSSDSVHPRLACKSRMNREVHVRYPGLRYCGRGRHRDPMGHQLLPRVAGLQGDGSTVRSGQRGRPGRPPRPCLPSEASTRGSSGPTLPCPGGALTLFGKPPARKARSPNEEWMTRETTTSAGVPVG